MGVLQSQLSFAAGEVSKQLWARRDLAKRQIALRRAENVNVMLEGGITRSPGTRYVAPLKSETNAAEFVPFRFSKTDAYMLVINGGVFRFYLNGGTVISGGVPYEIAAPWSDVDIPFLRWQNVTDSIFFVCPGYQPQVLKREGPVNWTLTPYLPGKPPLEPQNLDTASIVNVSGVSGAVLFNANTPLFQGGHIGTIWRLDESSIALTPLWLSGETLATNDERRWQGRVYRVVSGTDAGSNPPIHDEGEQSAGGGKVVWKFVHAGYGYVKINSLNNSGQAVGVIVGNEMPISVVVNGTYRWFEGAWSGARGWPEHVSQIDQALMFARGDTFWRSRPGDFYDFEIDESEHSALIGRFGAPDGELPKVEWLRSSGVIVVGCTGSEWIVRGPSPFDALTMANIRPLQQTTEGSASHRPAQVSGGVIFLGTDRRSAFFCRFSSLSDELDVDMVTKFARHILAGRARGLAFQRNPHRILWVWCFDGSLRALTFRPQEEMMGWTRRPMVNGAVEAGGVIPSEDGELDQLWLVVRRTVDGATRRYIEVMQPFFEPSEPDAPDANGAWYLDCALPLTSGTPVTTISGLEHLEGQVVGILADGAVQDTRTVSGGAITLTTPARDVIVGLPMTWRAGLLPLDSETTKTLAKQGRHVTLDMVDSAGGQMRVNGGDWEPIDVRGGYPLGGPITLWTGERAVNPASPTLVSRTPGAPPAAELIVDIEGSDPLPFTLSGVNVDIDARRP